MSLRELKMNSILLTALSLIILSSCDPFPTKEVFVRGADFCHKFEIKKDNPLEFANEQILNINECPIIYGFKEDDAGKVTDWVRRNQKRTCNQ